MTVANSSRTLHSICGSLLIALSFTDDGRLSTLLKCSAYLSKIVSLSVRSVLPFALSSGWHQNLLDHKLFSVHQGTSSYPSGLQKTEFLLLSFSAMSLQKKIVYTKICKTVQKIDSINLFVAA